jgi:hypothetical protein
VSGLLPLNLPPLLKLRNVASTYTPELAELQLRRSSDINLSYQYCTKRYPSLLERHSSRLQTDVIIDFVTGLMWESECSPARTIAEAILHTTSLDKAGPQLGWRLPTLEEALSLSPTNSDAFKSYPDSYPFNQFEGWASSVWTADTTHKGFPFRFQYKASTSAEASHPLESVPNVHVRCVRALA